MTWNATTNKFDISLPAAYSLPIATGSVLGGVMVDTTTIAVNATGVISAIKPSKWTTESINNIFYNTGNVGIGKTTALTNKLEVVGNLNISSGSKYKIGDVNLAFGDLGGTLSYNSLTNTLTAGTNISIVNNVVNNTYSLPTASTSVSGDIFQVIIIEG